MEHLTAFLTRIPKVELHVHLESTMPGEMLARFAARQGRELPRPAERLYDCSAEDLSDFLAFLDNICSFVGTPEELAEAAEHAALESGREHILYSEMILNPTHWPQFSVPEIIAAVTAGFDRAAAQGGADCRFTLSLSRTQTGAEAMALVDTMEEDSSFRERLLELLGEQHQEEHSGVFTSRGYAEPGSDFKEVYRKGEMFCFARPSAPVVLEVRKGFFDDPSYDNDKTTILNLPASDADIWRAVGEVDAASLDECAFRCIDCEIPSLRDAVDDAIEQEGGIGMASEFAANLAQKKQSWHEADWVKYKALLSVAGCPSLQDAIQLMHGLDDYDLRPDVAATWDYAEVVLREKYPDLPEELFQTPQAAMVGRQMLEENHAAITDYGLFRRKDNGQLPVFQREPQAMDSPQMGGM